ncbi:MAG: phosphotransferase, partial [Actinomycetes bacterium]
MTLLGQAPRLTAARAEEIGHETYGVATTAHPLPSERDQNFRLDVDGVPTYVLKVANRTESADVLAAQHDAAALALAAGLPVQRVHPTLDGAKHGATDGHLVRLLDWLPGVPLADVGRPSPALLH